MNAPDSKPPAATTISLPVPGSTAPSRTRQRLQFGLRALLVGMTLAGILFGLLGIQILRRSREAQAFNNLKQVGIGLHTYHDKYGALPAAASYDSPEQPLLSWRVYILPFIGHKELYLKFNFHEPWDSPHNKALVAEMPQVYESPITDAKIRVPPGSTCYLAVVGDRAMIAPKPTIPFQADHATQNDATPPLGVRLLEVFDGTSNTIMVVEAAPKSAVIWTRPDDWQINTQKPMAGLVGHRSGGFLSLFGDGSVRLIPQDFSNENLHLLFLRDDGQPLYFWDY